MGFIELGDDFKDAKETPMAKEGEYDLVCGEPEHDQARGNIMVPIRFESEGNAPFRHYINLPNAERDKKNDEDKGHKPGVTRKTKMIFLKRFCYGFSIPYTDTGFDTNNIPGARARLGVGITPVNDQGKGPYQNLRLPYLPDEEAVTAA